MEIKRGDVWYIESGYSTGSEQRPGRPAVIVSNDKNNAFSPTAEVVYLTTQPKHDLPTHAVIYSLGRESIAICEQITTVAIKRFGNYRGHITDEEMADIDEAMLVSLDLQGLSDMENELLNTEQSVPAPPDNSTVLAQLKAQLTEAETKCDVIQKMYDKLLSKVIKAG